MHRRLPLFAAAVALALPAVPAAAQTWPAGVVAGAPRALPAAGRPFVVQRDDAAGVRRSLRLRPADRTPQRGLTLAQAQTDDVPDVDVPARAEWSDDQGLHVSPTRLTFKRRF